MKSFVSILLLLSMLLLCVSCTVGTPANSQDPETESNYETESASMDETTASTESATTGSIESTKTDSVESDTSPIEDNGPKHYEIDLTLENFSTYLTYVVQTEILNGAYHTDYTHTISGVLSFAYYENVTVTFDVVYKNGSNTYKCEYTVSLNAAGDATFTAEDPALLQALHCNYKRDMERTYTIKDVSGKVIFNI